MMDAWGGEVDGSWMDREDDGRMVGAITGFGLAMDCCVFVQPVSSAGLVASWL